jgi:hypothetical protein
VHEAARGRSAPWEDSHYPARQPRGGQFCPIDHPCCPADRTCLDNCYSIVVGVGAQPDPSAIRPIPTSTLFFCFRP